MNNQKKKLIYLVDDDEWYVELMAMRLQADVQYEIKTFTTGEAMLKDLSETPDLIVLDNNLNSTQADAKNGKEVMEALVQKNVNSPVILLSGNEDVSTAVNLLKYNASDYIVKGDDALDKLANSIEKVFSFQELQEKEEHLVQEKNKLQKRIFLASFLCMLVILVILLT